MFGYKCRWEFTCCVLRHWRSPILLQYNHKANHINPVRSRSSDVRVLLFRKNVITCDWDDLLCVVTELTSWPLKLNWSPFSHVSKKETVQKWHSLFAKWKKKKKKLLLSKGFNMASFEHHVIMPRNLETVSAVKLCHITLLSSLLINLRQILQCSRVLITYCYPRRMRQSS